VRGHPGAVQQALLNLVVNAADTIASARGNTNARGLITVRTRRDAECVIVSLEDTGSGIPDDIRTRIYDLFFTTKGVGEGTGQGLAIARSIVVDTHGGELWFETDPGQGTTFFIRLNIEGPGHG
jgi:signal transduction histidine kinase